MSKIDLNRVAGLVDAIWASKGYSPSERPTYFTDFKRSLNAPSREAAARASFSRSAPTGVGPSQRPNPVVQPPAASAPASSRAGSNNDVRLAGKFGLKPRGASNRRRANRPMPGSRRRRMGGQGRSMRRPGSR